MKHPLVLQCRGMLSQARGFLFIAIGCLMRSFLTHSCIVLILCACAGSAQRRAALPTGTKPPDYVILLHGLGRTTFSMRSVEEHLSANGFRVVNVGYPSLTHPIEDHAELLQGQIEKHCVDKTAKIHFVTHSMGGILLRYYAENYPLDRLGRVVMLAPPNGGCEIIDRLGNTLVFNIFMGPSAKQLGTDPDSVPSRLGPVEFELGIIAGDKKTMPLLNRLVPGDSDGVVSLDQAQVEGMTDFLIVHHGHTFIMNSAEVHRQIVHFLRNGKFQKEEEN